MDVHSDQASDSTRLRLVSPGSTASQPHVVIVGAGFGGLTAAKRLATAAVEVTLIDRENHHLFQPLLYQVATAGLRPHTLENMRWQGTGPKFRKHGGRIVYHRDELKQWSDTCRRKLSSGPTE